MNNNIVIYTCIIGNYEKPTDNFSHKEGFDYVLVSDSPVNTSSWTNKIVHFDMNKSLDNAKKQRYIKTHPDLLFPDYEISVYIDGNTPINQKLYDYIDRAKATNHPIVFKKHPERNCIYKELEANITCKKEDPEIVKTIEKRYREEGMPENFGLFENNVIIRHHNDNVCKLIMGLWFTEIRRHSHRDQLSLTYVLWKYNMMKYVHGLDSNDFHPLVHKK